MINSPLVGSRLGWEQDRFDPRLLFGELPRSADRFRSFVAIDWDTLLIQRPQRWTTGSPHNLFLLR